MGDTITGFDSFLRVALSPSGIRAITSSYSGSVSYWDLEAGEEIDRFQYEQSIACLSLSRDGRFAATGSSASVGTIYLRDLQRGKDLHRWQVPRGSYNFDESPVTCVGFLPNNDCVFAGSVGGACGVFAWDVTTGNLKCSFAGGWVNSLAVSPDGRHMLVGYGRLFERLEHLRHESTCLREFPSGKEVWRAQHTMPAEDVAFSTDGLGIVSASRGEKDNVQSWRLKRGWLGGWRPEATFTEEEPILALAVASEGREILWVTPTGIRMGSGERVATVYEGKISCASISADTRRIVVAEDKIARLIFR